MTLRVGSTVYNCVQGLGVLAKDFYDHGIVTDPVIIRRDGLRSRPPQHDWYPADTPSCPIGRIPSADIVKRWKRDGVGVALFFETPFDWNLLALCRDAGIKTALMPMHECMPARLPRVPDLMICPSLLELQIYRERKGFPSAFLPVPVDRAKVPWRKRERALTFVHNAGHGGLKGRNGTREVVEAMRHVTVPCEVILRTQGDSALPVPLRGRGTTARVTQHVGDYPYGELWRDGDVFLFPEKFNSLSLPLQEARAAGMLVMCGDRFPMNTWLPKDYLIPVQGYSRNKIGPPYLEFDEAVFDPHVIAAKIDEWYGQDISAYSEAGREWAALHSWSALKPAYTAALEAL